jgi:hypothetical protein
MSEKPIPSSLADIQYRVLYRPNDNPLENFYLPTLAASAHYDGSISVLGRRWENKSISKREVCQW